MLRRLFTPSMVVALLALTVALSGTAVAAKGLITGAQIKDHSIGYVDISTLAVGKLRGRVGRVGPPGPQGAQGPAGATGATGPAGTTGTFSSANVQVVNSGQVPVNPESAGQAEATCPAGTKLIGGGMITGATYIASAPAGNAWLAGVFDTSTSVASSVTAYALCAA